MSQKELTYKSVENEILKRITSGVYHPGQKLPPERLLEKEFAVSRLTIAKGLSNLTSAGYITRTRGRGSFVCDHVPSGIRANGRDLNVKGIVKYISPPGCVNGAIAVSHGIMEGIHGVLTPVGFHVGVDFYSSVEQQLELLTRFSDPIHEAFVVWPVLDPRILRELHRMQAGNFPFVLVDTYFPEFKCDYIISDNARGAEMMVSYLVENGHRRISYFTAPPDRISMADRFSGVISGLSKHGIAINSGTINIMSCDDKVTGGSIDSNMEYLSKRLNELMMSPSAPTAIFCSNDWIAMLVYDILIERGIKIPEQVSLAGFDNIDASQYQKVPLTTVAQNFFEIGRLAAKIVLSRKQLRSSIEMISQQRVTPRLVIRDSVRKLI